MIFTDIYELFIDLRTNGSNNILTADEPMKLLIGWIDMDTGKTWQIKICDIKAGLYQSKYYTKNSGKIIHEMIQDIDKRRNILDTIRFLDISHPLFEKYYKLRAFW